MRLKGFKIGNTVYYCTPTQIEEAGSIEKAAQKMAGIEPKPEKVKKEPEGIKPEEKIKQGV
jgi:hypothetical protein